MVNPDVDGYRQLNPKSPEYIPRNPKNNNLL